ncbi:MAG TPA: hypothetical protein PKC30_06900 [Saprospiraceae bacterium]|nr:hypothetical protein [Saprospiraceae bacterium]
MKLDNSLIYYTYFTLIIFSIVTFKSCMPESGESDWEAIWISHPDDFKSENSWFVFKKSWNISRKGTDPLMARISADSKYWLYINDSLVVYEGNLKRGPTPNDGYYDRVDIGPYLKTGDNTVEVLLWFWGREGYSHKNSGHAGIIFEARQKKDHLFSDSTWLVSRHPAYYTTMEKSPNYRLPEFNVAYDARLQEMHWVQAMMYGKPPVKPWGKLWERPFPLWKDYGLKEYEEIQINESDSMIMVKGKLPKNISISPYFDITTAQSGEIIDIRTDNYFGGSEPELSAQYITKEGRQAYESLGYLNGHEMIYYFPKGTEIHRILYRETRFNTDLIGKFVSDNTRLNQLWEKATNTLNLNLRDAIQNPDKDRAQWWGDVVIILSNILYTLDQNGVKSIIKGMSNLIEWRKDDGILFSPIPAGNWDKEQPAQMLASIGEFGFWRYFEYTNDRATLGYVYPYIKKYIELWQTSEDGLIEHRPDDWAWYDWGNGIDVQLLDQLWFYQALTSTSKMADILGKKSEAEKWLNQANRLKDLVQNEFWREDHFASSNYPINDLDDRANGLAVVLGFAESGRWEELKTKLFQTRKAGPYMEKYVVEAFFKMGDVEAGLERMMERYSEMIDSPMSTLWEGWQAGSGLYGKKSYNHGVSGWPITIAGEYIAGIRPLSPGFEEIEWKPNLRFFHHLDFVMPVKDQTLQINYHWDDMEAFYHLKTDKQTLIKTSLGSRELIYYNTLSINGSLVMEGGEIVNSGKYNVEMAGDGSVTFYVNTSDLFIELK